MERLTCLQAGYFCLFWNCLNLYTFYVVPLPVVLLSAIAVILGSVSVKTVSVKTVPVITGLTNLFFCNWHEVRKLVTIAVCELENVKNMNLNILKHALLLTLTSVSVIPNNNASSPEDKPMEDVAGQFIQTDIYQSETSRETDIYQSETSRETNIYQSETSRETDIPETFREMAYLLPSLICARFNPIQSTPGLMRYYINSCTIEYLRTSVYKLQPCDQSIINLEELFKIIVSAYRAFTSKLYCNSSVEHENKLNGFQQKYIELIYTLRINFPDEYDFENKKMFRPSILAMLIELWAYRSIYGMFENAASELDILSTRNESEIKDKFSISTPADLLKHIFELLTQLSINNPTTQKYMLEIAQSFQEFGYGYIGVKEKIKGEVLSDIIKNVLLMSGFLHDYVGIGLRRYNMSENAVKSYAINFLLNATTEELVGGIPCVSENPNETKKNIQMCLDGLSKHDNLSEYMNHIRRILFQYIDSKKVISNLFCAIRKNATNGILGLKDLLNSDQEDYKKYFLGGKELDVDSANRILGDLVSTVSSKKVFRKDTEDEITTALKKELIRYTDGKIKNARNEDFSEVVKLFLEIMQYSRNMKEQPDVFTYIYADRVSKIDNAKEDLDKSKPRLEKIDDIKNAIVEYIQDEVVTRLMSKTRIVNPLNKYAANEESKKSLYDVARQNIIDFFFDQSGSAVTNIDNLLNHSRCRNLEKLKKTVKQLMELFDKLTSTVNQKITEGKKMLYACKTVDPELKNFDEALAAGQNKAKQGFKQISNILNRFEEDRIKVVKAHITNDNMSINDCVQNVNSELSGLNRQIKRVSFNPLNNKNQK